MFVQFSPKSGNMLKVSPTCTRRPYNISSCELWLSVNFVQVTIQRLRYLGDQKIIFKNFFCLELGATALGGPWSLSTLPTPFLPHCWNFSNCHSSWNIAHTNQICVYMTRKTYVAFNPNYLPTRSSAIAEGPRDASCQLKSCQLPRNSAETTCTQVLNQVSAVANRPVRQNRAVDSAWRSVR